MCIEFPQLLELAQKLCVLEDFGVTQPILNQIEWRCVVCCDLSLQASLMNQSERWRIPYKPVRVCDEATHTEWVQQAEQQKAECEAHTKCLKEIEKIVQVGASLLLCCWGGEGASLHRLCIRRQA